jgi:hypothetical protein
MKAEEEVAAIKRLGVCELVPRPKDRKVLPCLWVLKVKEDGRLSARLVAKGCAQRPGIDVGDVYASAVRPETIRALLAVAAEKDFELKQLDVTKAFLYGDLKEEVYMEQPPGFCEGGSDFVWRLKKSLYGLRQAPRAWQARLTEELEGIGFAAADSDPSLFIKRREVGGPIYLLAYVDDCLLVAPCGETAALDSVKQQLSLAFDLRDLGEPKFFLGMEIERDRPRRTIKLSQQRYIGDLLEKFNLSEARPKAVPADLQRLLPGDDNTCEEEGKYPYCELVGALLWVSTRTRPDISYAVGELTRFMGGYTQQHWEAAKTVLRYLKGTRSLGLVYGGKAVPFSGHCDSDYAGCPVTRRSIGGYVFTLNGAAVCWSARRQKSVARSTMEAEYYAAAEAVLEALWLRKLRVDLGMDDSVIQIFTDNQASLHLLQNSSTSQRSKHIDVCYHFARERVQMGQVSFQHVSTDHMIADIFTKPLAKDKVERFRLGMGIHS